MTKGLKSTVLVMQEAVPGLFSAVPDRSKQCHCLQFCYVHR